MQESIIGMGRIGTALAALGPALCLRRGESIPATPAGPIYVCTRNDDLAAVLAVTPPERRADLVFVQNGMLHSWLAARGLSDNTQALLYFAVSAVGDAPVDGGQTVAYGPWAEALAARLQRGGVACRVAPDAAAYREQVIEKFLWICVFGLLSQALGEPVGTVATQHRAEVEALTAELGGICQRALGTPIPPQLVARLCDYSASIADYRGGVKELPWRNGWLLAQERTPLHLRWLARAGVPVAP